jgi:YbbR domain-containing protein
VNNVGRLIFGHWPLKLMALLLATLLYAGLALADSTRSFAGPVPIEVLNAPVGGALLDHPGVVDSIEYRAPADIADALTNDSFRASIDLSNVQPRAGAEPVEVPVDVFPVDPRVRVVDYSPTGVTVRVDEVVTRTMPVTVDHGPLPEGIEMGPITTDPNQVTISGASSRLQNVRSVEGNFVVDASGININEDVRVDALDELGVVVPGIEVDPRLVRVRADAARQLAYATIPVIPDLIGQPARGRRVDNVSVVPASVTVSGENPDIHRLESVMTAPVDISDQSVEMVTDVPLVFPDEVTSPGEGTVSVIVTFTDAVGSRSYEVGTALVGAQPGFTYAIAEPSVSVIISGSVTQLDALDPKGLIAAVPVGDLQVGDNDVMPTVEAPRGTSVVSVTPSTVRVAVESSS